MNSAEIMLPWPDRRLSPNARVHWATLARAKKLTAGQTLALAWEAKLSKIDAERLAVKYTFHPPSRRRFDLDNLVASMKAANDALAFVTGVDDSKWDLAISPLGEVIKGGAVKVELQWGDA